MGISAGLSRYANGPGMLDVIEFREETPSPRPWYLEAWRTLEVEGQKKPKVGT
jgi:hypothetical protein